LDLGETRVTQAILDALGGIQNISVSKLNGLSITGESLNSLAVSLGNLKLMDRHPSLEKVYVLKNPGIQSGKS